MLQSAECISSCVRTVALMFSGLIAPISSELCASVMPPFTALALPSIHVCELKHALLTGIRVSAVFGPKRMLPSVMYVLEQRCDAC